MELLSKDCSKAVYIVFILLRYLQAESLFRYLCPENISLSDQNADSIWIQNGSYISFEIKCANDACLMLHQNEDDYHTNATEIHLLLKDSGLSFIIDGETRQFNWTHDPYLLSPFDFRLFWISWTSFDIRVGKGDEPYKTQILQLPKLPYDINYLSVGTNCSGKCWRLKRGITATQAAHPHVVGHTSATSKSTNSSYSEVIRCLNCTFESGLCAWEQDASDHFNWTIYRGNTPSEYIRPTSDHTSRDRYYIYIESSPPRETGEKARLISPKIKPGSFCLEFRYFIYGNHLATLNVYKKSETANNDTAIFQRNGDTSFSEWRKGVASLRYSEEFQIVFEGIVDGPRGDIAVDDIFLTKRMCSADCDFDSDLCNWTQGSGDDFDWVIFKGSSATLGTGPLDDHTGGGHYVYIETSGPRSSGDRARLVSPGQGPGVYCLKFWYSMYGKHINRLNVYKKTNGDNESQLISLLTTSRESAWTEHVYSFQAKAEYQIVIEGVCGDGYEGDIAVDDISLIPGRCITESMNRRDLSIVYWTVPLAAVIVAVAVTAVVCRKKILRCPAIISRFGNVKKKHIYDYPSYQDGNLSHEDEHVETADERHGIEQRTYPTIADIVTTAAIEIQHSFNSTNQNRMQVTDNVMEEAMGATNEWNHGHDNLVVGTTSEYYSLEPQSVDEKHYSVLMRVDNDIKTNDGATDSEYEQPVGATPKYFVL